MMTDSNVSAKIACLAVSKVTLSVATLKPATPHNEEALSRIAKKLLDQQEAPL